MVEVSIGIVLYPGAQLSAALGLTDLFKVAGRTAYDAEPASPRLRVRHLRVEREAETVVVFDSDSDAIGQGVGPCDVLILPPSLEPPISADGSCPNAWCRIADLWRGPSLIRRPRRAA